jgi:predicted DNA-binding protein
MPHSSPTATPRKPRRNAVRASISFPPELHKTLEDLAHKKRVSLAWIVRDASERYAAQASAAVQ